MDQPFQSPQPSPDDQKEYFTPFMVDLSSLKSQGEVQKYLDEFALLAPEVQNFLNAMSTADYIEDKLGSQFVLSKEQKRGVARVIRDVAWGRTYMGDVSQTLIQQYGVEGHIAPEISRMVLYQLLTPVIDDIKRVQKENFPQRVNPAAPPKPAPSPNLYSAPPSVPSPQLSRPAPPVPQYSQPDVNPDNVIDLRNQQN